MEINQTKVKGIGEHNGLSPGNLLHYNGQGPVICTDLLRHGFCHLSLTREEQLP